MTYEFNASDVENKTPNPFKVENIFLGWSSLALIAAGCGILFIARGYFNDQLNHVAMATAALAFAVFGTGVKFAIQALSQMRFFFGRNFPIGLADELLPSARGKSERAALVQDTLRQRSIHFPEPTGPLNGILYSAIKDLIVAPPTIQYAAVRHFHAIAGMVAILISLIISSYLFAGNEFEGVVSWLYLPMTGLSLATPLIRKEGDNVPPNSNRLLWNLVGLLAFAILAPAVVPKYFPHYHIPPMWIAPAALLVTSIAGSVLFLISLLKQLEPATQTAVSMEQRSIDMNCNPAQLWAEVGREFQRNWNRDIPNRSYINLPPEVDSGDRGSFQGHVLEETQPLIAQTMRFDSVMEAFHSPRGKHLVMLGLWGIFLSVLTGAVAVYLASGFGEMSRFEISRSMLTVFALGTSNILAYNVGNLLWSRMYYKSRLIWIESEGTFLTSELDIGNQITGRIRSKNKMTRIEAATLRIWMADVSTVSFGKEGKRFIMSMAPADGYTRQLSEHLTNFALNQSSIAVPTTERDLARAQSIVKMDEQIGGNRIGADIVNKLTGGDPERLTGTIKFYDPAGGFGFITQDRGPDLYFSKRELSPESAIDTGSIVTFAMSRNVRGPCAVRIVEAH